MNAKSFCKSENFRILGIVFVVALLIDWTLAPLLDVLGVASTSWSNIVFEGIAYILLAIFATWLYAKFIDRQLMSFRRFELHAATVIVIVVMLSFGIMVIFEPGGLQYANLSILELAQSSFWGLIERLVFVFLVFGIVNPIFSRKDNT